MATAKGLGRQSFGSGGSKTPTPLESQNSITSQQTPLHRTESEDNNVSSSPSLAERRLLWKVDLRLCTIAGLLCSLNLLDSSIISSASVTSMISDLDLQGNRYSVSIFIFTLAQICFQLPATILMRFIGPPIFFGCCTVCFGIITLSTAYITSWRQMIVMRVLLGISMSGVFPGLTYLVSTWYTRKEQQLRFAFLQSGEVFILATGSIVNYGLNHLDNRHGLRGWQWMFLVQGVITIFLGLITFTWIPHFPEHSHKTYLFLDQDEQLLAIKRIDHDRHDAGAPNKLNLTSDILPCFLDPKLYAFCTLFFLLNIVSTALAYFLPIILQSGMGFSSNQSILLSAPPYYYAIIPALISSYIGDKYQLRSPIITFNAISLITGFAMLGFANQVTVRYIGTYLATGAYISNWAALNAYQANNITGQWKRATFAAAISACNGAGGIAGSYIVRSTEAPRYITAIWVSIGSHLLMLVVVGLCTLFFWFANRKVDAFEREEGGSSNVGVNEEEETRRRRRKKMLIEETEGFRYTY